MTEQSAMAPLEAWETIELFRDRAVAIIRLNRPRARNAVDDAMRADLRAVIDYVMADTSIRGVVLTGAGTSFCAGGDIKSMEERLQQGALGAEAGWRRQRALHESLVRLFHLDRPTVAAVNGPASGLGLDLALTCDFVWAAETATFSSSFVNSGLVPDGGGLFHMPRRIGLARAKELAFSGRVVPAKEGLEMGLVDRLVPDAELVQGAVDWLNELGRLPRMSQALSKGILNRSYEISLEEVNTLGSQAQAICYGTPEHLDRVRGFIAARDARRQQS